MLVKLQSAVALFTCGCLVSVAASPSSIGIVVTRGRAQVDGVFVRGNSTLFQGSLVHTDAATSDLMLPRGSNLLLQPGSGIKVYREYAVLQNGGAIQRGNPAYLLVADGLKIHPLSAQGAAFVDMQDNSHLRVAAQGGAVEVRNNTGALMARLDAGNALSFAVQVQQQTPAAPAENPAPASGQAAPPTGTQLTLHGILRKDHPGRYGHFLLTDLASNVTYELQGPGLDDLVGASVEATGSTFDTTPAAGASRVVAVSDTPAAAPPTPSGDTAPPSNAGPEVGATPEATAPPEPNNAPTPPPLPQHSDTAKILVIVGLAAGAVVGVALGLGGGKSSTVSPE
jgi:hypothetical protein